MEIPRVRFEGRSDPAARCQQAERAAWRPDLQPGPGRGSPAKPGRGGGPGTRQRSSPNTLRPGVPPRKSKREPLPELSLFLLPDLFSVSTGDRACLPYSPGAHAAPVGVLVPRLEEFEHRTGGLLPSSGGPPESG